MGLLARLVFSAAVFATAASAQDAGDLPPALTWDKLKGDCPASLDWASLRGRAVVISVRNLDPGAMTANPPDPSAVFLIVFSGSEFLLDQALEQSGYAGCVLFDAKGVMRQSFGVARASQRTIVVDDRGYIASISPKPFVTYQTDTAANPDRSYTVHIAPTQKFESPHIGMVIGEPGHYVTRNGPLNFIISDLWEMPMARIAFPGTPDDTRYDVIANMPTGDDALVRTLVQEAVQAYFGLRIEKETRSVRSYQLKTVHPSPHLQPAKEGEEDLSAASDSFEGGTAADIRDIAARFQEILGVPVIDQTGLKGKYDYFFASKLQAPESAFDMADQLGLALEEVEQPVELLVVQKLR